MENETSTNYELGDIFEGANTSIFNPSSEREGASEIPQDPDTVTFDWESQSFKNEGASKSYQGYFDSQQPTGSATVTQSEKKTNEQKKAEKKKVKNDIYTLTGSLEVNPISSVCGSLKTGNTVSITGVGKALTGKYLIKNKEVCINTSGASCTIEVIKTGFEGTDVNGGNSK